MTGRFHSGIETPEEAAPLQIEELQAFPTDEEGIDEWDEAVDRLGGSVYMTVHWLRTWWTHYGAGGALRLFVAREAGAVVGLVPMYVTRLRLGLVRITVARIVGANIPPKAFEVPLHPASSRPFVSAVCARLLDAGEVDLISLGPLSDAAPGVDGLREALGSGLACSTVHERPYDVVTLFTVPSTLDEYLASIGQSERRFRRKKLAQLERDFEVSSDVVSDPQAVAVEFERFCQHHAAQWAAEGRGGHFRSWPRAVEFNRALVTVKPGRVQPLFFRLLVNGDVVANRYAYRLGTRLYSELTSREVGPEWDRRGLGTVSSHAFMEAAIGLGVTEVSSGLGHYGHKARMGAREVQTSIWRITGQGRWRRWKVRAFLAMTRATRVVVHKVWYRRIVPRLPAAFSRCQPWFLVRLDC